MVNASKAMEDLSIEAHFFPQRQYCMPCHARKSTMMFPSLHLSHPTEISSFQQHPIAARMVLDHLPFLAQAVKGSKAQMRSSKPNAKQKGLR
jgi:uncharacterized OB-fold protein